MQKLAQSIISNRYPQWMIEEQFLASAGKYIAQGDYSFFTHLCEIWTIANYLSEYKRSVSMFFHITYTATRYAKLTHEIYIAAEYLNNLIGLHPNTGKRTSTFGSYQLQIHVQLQ